MEQITELKTKLTVVNNKEKVAVTMGKQPLGRNINA